MSLGLLLQAILSLVFVLGLLFITLWAVKYIETNSTSKRFFNKLNSKRRLEILEIKRIDSRNSLVLIRRDETEHLLLVGTSAQVIEKDIKQDKGQKHEKKN